MRMDRNKRLSLNHKKIVVETQHKPDGGGSLCLSVATGDRRAGGLLTPVLNGPR